MPELKHIIVTGGNGQLGMEFQQLQSAFPDYQFHFPGRDQFSIDHVEQVNHYFASHQIDILINCAAYTAVDKAEEEQETALRINAEAVAYLSNLCAAHHVKFFHFSTDYVFDGEGKEPYKEIDATQPVNFYGITKLAGEQAILSSNPGACILRTSWVYSPFGKNFVKTMLRLMNEKKEIQVVADQYGSPTYAADLANSVMQMITSGKKTSGIYHYCNEGVISWYEFATAIQEITNANCMVHPIPTEAFPTTAKRPRYSALSTTKIKQVFSLEIPHWRISLEKCLKKLQEV